MSEKAPRLPFTTLGFEDRGNTTKIPDVVVVANNTSLPPAGTESRGTESREREFKAFQNEVKIKGGRERILQEIKNRQAYVRRMRRGFNLAKEQIKAKEQSRNPEIEGWSNYIKIRKHLTQTLRNIEGRVDNLTARGLWEDYQRMLDLSERAVHSMGKYAKEQQEGGRHTASRLVEPTASQAGGGNRRGAGDNTSIAPRAGRTNRSQTKPERDEKATDAENWTDVFQELDEKHEHMVRVAGKLNILDTAALFAAYNKARAGIEKRAGASRAEGVSKLLRMQTAIISDLEFRTDIHNDITAFENNIVSEAGRGLHDFGEWIPRSNRAGYRQMLNEIYKNLRQETKISQADQRSIKVRVTEWKEYARKILKDYIRAPVLTLEQAETPVEEKVGRIGSDDILNKWNEVSVLDQRLAASVKAMMKSGAEYVERTNTQKARRMKEQIAGLLLKMADDDRPLSSQEQYAALEGKIDAYRTLVEDVLDRYARHKYPEYYKRIEAAEKEIADLDAFLGTRTSALRAHQPEDQQPSDMLRARAEYEEACNEATGFLKKHQGRTIPRVELLQFQDMLTQLELKAARVAMEVQQSVYRSELGFFLRERYRNSTIEAGNAYAEAEERYRNAQIAYIQKYKNAHPKMTKEDEARLKDEMIRTVMTIRKSEEEAAFKGLPKQYRRFNAIRKMLLQPSSGKKDSLLLSVMASKENREAIREYQKQGGKYKEEQIPEEVSASAEDVSIERSKGENDSYEPLPSFLVDSEVDQGEPYQEALDPKKVEKEVQKIIRSVEGRRTFWRKNAFEQIKNKTMQEINQINDALQEQAGNRRASKEVLKSNNLKVSTELWNEWMKKINTLEFKGWGENMTIEEYIGEAARKTHRKSPPAPHAIPF